MAVVNYKTQADKRRPQNMTDQHGRSWHCSIEKESGMPTGLIQHLFTVPEPALVPPQKYLTFDANNASRVHIDYDTWIRDLEERRTEYETERVRMGVFTSNPKELSMILGPPPMPKLPVYAMAQGNKWALGLSDEKPPEAYEFFPAAVTADTAPVFSGDVWSAPRDASRPPTIAEQLNALEARCPANLVGSARNNWLMAEMRKITAAVPQEA